MDAMQASIATDVKSVPPPSSIPPSPTSQPTRLSPHTTNVQSSPSNKRPVPDVDTPMQDAPTLFSLNDSTVTSPVSTENKENRDSAAGSKGGELAGTMAPPAVPAHATPEAGTPSAAKKRKLSPASREAKQQEKEAKQQEKEAKQQEKEAKQQEREAKQQEREAKERQRLEEKARKDEEKAKREEEKRKRDAEKEEERKKREEKKKVKDEEKAAREEEKRKKDEEKLKKERAQMKLNSFFLKPKGPAAQPALVTRGSPQKPSDDGDSAESSEKTEKTTDISHYKREFPDFFLHANTHLAPQHRFQRDAQAIAHLQANVDSSFDTGSAEQLTFRPSELFRLMPYKRRRGYQKMSVKDILLQMQSLNDQPETSEAARKLQDSLKQVRMKSLKFGEDVRPPYQGTYTKHLPKETAARLMRNPFRRELPEVNYDYDSEAEWEDAEEGEELDSEEEEEGSEDGDEDMDGFLDDEDDHLANGKRRLLVGDLEPVCSGIQWQDQEPDPELQVYKIETILPAVTFPIDPFSTSYWQPKPKAPEPGHIVPGLGQQRPAWNFSTVNPVTQNPALVSTQNGKKRPGNPKQAFPVDQLAELKGVIEGSDLTKTGLVEVLKKRFPKVSKGTLKETLDSVATRVGQKEADKKWVCK